MSARLCGKCGYDLSGLPTEGTVVTCPECEHTTDLSIPLLDRESPWVPLLWAMVPMALAVLGIAPDLLLGGHSVKTPALLTVTGLLGGAITAGCMMYGMIERGPGTGRTWRPHRTRLVLSVCAAVASVVLNALIMLGAMFLLSFFVRL